MMTEAFAAQNIRDSEGLASLVRSSLKDLTTLSLRRATLSLPDGIFRVQTLEFDELPSQRRDRDRLVRWRLEKGAAFDVSNTVLRYQVVPRRDKGCSVLACVAKQEVISQFEDLLTGLGLEPWAVAPSSFNVLNFYGPYLEVKNIPGFALAWVTEGSYTTIILEQGGPRFYRHKEIKAVTPADVTVRLMRELDDSLHFYLHMKARLAQFGLEVAPDKTRVVRFGRYGGEYNGRFDFLGFEFRWEKSRWDKPIVKRRTSPKKLRSAVVRFTEWIRKNRSSRLRKVMAQVRAKYRGYGRYYGLIGNSKSLNQYGQQTQRILLKWLNRRSQRRRYTWASFRRMLERFQVELPKVWERSRGWVHDLSRW